MMYKSSWKLIFLKIFAPNGFLFSLIDGLRLNLQDFAWHCIYIRAERAVMLIKKVTNLGECGYLNSSCIRKSIDRFHVTSPLSKIQN